MTDDYSQSHPQMNNNYTPDTGHQPALETFHDIFVHTSFNEFVLNGHMLMCFLCIKALRQLSCNVCYSLHRPDFSPYSQRFLCPSTKGPPICPSMSSHLLLTVFQIFPQQGVNPPPKTPTTAAPGAHPSCKAFPPLRSPAAVRAALAAARARAQAWRSSGAACVLQ